MIAFDLTPAAPSLPRDRVAEILRAVSTRHGVTVAAMLGPERHASTVRARHVAIFLTRRLTKLSLSATGHRFGDRRSATVMHACQKVEHLLKRSELAADIDAVLAALGVPSLPPASPAAITRGNDK